MPARQRTAEEIIGNDFTQRNNAIYFYTLLYYDFLDDIYFSGSFLCNISVHFWRLKEKIAYCKLQYDRS